MNPFAYRDGRLFAEETPVADIAAQFGTPCYVYSRAALAEALQDYLDALKGRDALVCFAVKSNSNLAVIDLFARLGAGFDVVSGGELARVIAAGADPRKVVFSGVGKTAEEMRHALQAGILCFNVESAPELDRLNVVAGELGMRAPVSLRVNPNVDAKTHPYISTGLRQNKFGVAFEDALALYRRAASMPHLKVTGIDCHIGSQLLDPAPAAEALDRILGLADQLAAEGIALEHMDLGGGMGIRYRDEDAPSAANYLAPMLAKLDGRPWKIILEPGRSLVGNAGILVTRVEYLKRGEEKHFAIVDAAMNDLIRPALYEAWHDIVAVTPRAETPEEYDIVGPVCESGDFLGHGRMLSVAPGDLLAVKSAGAYGMVLSSNYNTRPRAAEVMVDGAAVHLVREREAIADLFRQERRLPG